VIGDQ